MRVPTEEDHLVAIGQLQAFEDLVSHPIASNLSERDLVRLRAHLQPHFLRNTLNTISALVTEDPRQARRLIATIGDLLTDELTSDMPARRLSDEMGWLKRYAEIVDGDDHREARRFDRVKRDRAHEIPQSC